MPYYAGLDWSGTPDAPVDSATVELYVPCLVAVPSNDLLHEFLASTRQEFGLPRDCELHGHQLRKKPDILLRIVDFALGHAAVITLMFNKNTLIAGFGQSIFNKPVLLAPATGLLVVHLAMQTIELGELTYDEGDIKGDRRKMFGTSVKREARAHGFESPRVRPSESKKSDHVQIADVVAYVLQRDELGMAETTALEQSVRKLRRSANCTIRVGEADDLRSYLPP